MLNNREFASLIWLAIVFAFVIWRPDVLRGFAGVLRAALHWKVCLTLVSFALYVVGLVLLGRAGHIWNVDALVITLYWFVGAGLALLFNATRAAEPGFLGTTILSTVKISVFVEFFVNLYVFHLAIELVLIPTIFLFAAMAALANVEPKYSRAKPAIDGVLATIGVVLAVYVFTRLLTDWEAIAWEASIKEIGVPIWLTLGAVPFVFSLGGIATYESAFLRIDSATDDGVKRRRLKLALLTTLRLDFASVASFAGTWPRRAAEKSHLPEMRDVISQFQTSRRQLETSGESTY